MSGVILGVFAVVFATFGDAPLVKATSAVGDSTVWKDASAFAAEPKAQDKWMSQANAHVIVEGLPVSGSVAERTKGWTYGIDLDRKELYRLGLGRFQGDVGCVETRFNPWLYSDRVADAPRSTLLVRISGTTAKGVELARKAFLSGMNNGVVIGKGAKRMEASILDLNPSDEPPPTEVLSRLAVPTDCVYAGWSQCPAQEYRAFLDWGAAEEPRRVWRVKYLTADSLKSASGATWADSPLLSAFGHAVTIADCRKETAAKRILGSMPSRAVDFPRDEVGYGKGKVRFLVQGRYFIMTSLPEGK